MRVKQLIERLAGMVAAGMGDAEIAVAVDYMEASPGYKTGHAKILRLSRDLRFMARPEEKLLLLFGNRSLPLKQADVDPKTIPVKVEPTMATRIKELALQKEAQRIKKEKEKAGLLTGLVPSLAEPVGAPLPPFPPTPRLSGLRLMYPDPKPSKSKKSSKPKKGK